MPGSACSSSAHGEAILNPVLEWCRWCGYLLAETFVMLLIFGHSIMTQLECYAAALEDFTPKPYTPLTVELYRADA